MISFFILMAKLLGAHLSTAKGLHSLQKQMKEIGADTCACFLRNPRSYNAKPLDKKQIELFKENVPEPELFLPHAPYIMNLAVPNDHIKVLQDDLTKCDQLGIRLYNLHPGSDTVKLGRKKALENISMNFNKVTTNATIVIENMAGDGNKVGGSFEDLAEIIANVEDKTKIGVCLDTCHLFGYGYDIRTAEKFDKIMVDFDRIVGLRYLKGMHLNDSKIDLATKKDRHENLGKGKIGLEAFEYIMNSDKFSNVPMILETPDMKLYAKEIELLRGMVKKEDLC